MISLKTKFINTLMIIIRFRKRLLMVKISIMIYLKTWKKDVSLHFQIW